MGINGWVIYKQGQIVWMTVFYITVGNSVPNWRTKLFDWLRSVWWQEHQAGFISDCKSLDCPADRHWGHPKFKNDFFRIEIREFMLETDRIQKL